MRQITAETNYAVQHKENFSKSNMIVRYDKEQNISDVFLHGNRIAKYDYSTQLLELSTCGWETNTTKDRLNGLLDLFNLGYIHQKDYVWYYTDKDNNTEGFKGLRLFPNVTPF